MAELTEAQIQGMVDAGVKKALEEERKAKKDLGQDKKIGILEKVVSHLDDRVSKWRLGKTFLLFVVGIIIGLALMAGQQYWNPFGEDGFFGSGSMYERALKKLQSQPKGE